MKPLDGLNPDNRHKTSPSEEDFESIPEDAEHWKREHFIPIRPAELTELLIEQFAADDQEQAKARQLAAIIEASLHHQSLKHYTTLKSCYAIFDPDSDTHSVREHQSDNSRLFFDRFVEVLEAANYTELTRKEIERAVRTTSDWGVNLHVDFELFDRLEVYTRGDVVGQKTRRHWRNFWRLETVSTQLYQRLVVVFRLREHPRLDRHADTEAIYIKMFKNIPQADIDTLLPGTKVRMTLLDQGKILVPTLSGVAFTLFKLSKLLLTTTIVFGLSSMLTFIGLVGGTIGYGIKSFFGYMNTRDKYHLNLTRSLYYQNLDNNGGVIFRVLNDAYEQEYREVIIAYMVLAQAGETGLTEAEVDKNAERLLQDWLSVAVDFECHDALRKLFDLGLATARADKTIHPLSIGSALQSLDKRWDNIFRFDEAENVDSRHTARPWSISHDDQPGIR